MKNEITGCNIGNHINTTSSSPQTPEDDADKIQTDSRQSAVRNGNSINADVIEDTIQTD
jgi:hypothetical protein